MARLRQALRSLLSELQRSGCRDHKSVLLIVNSRTKFEAGLDGTTPIELQPLQRAVAKKLLRQLSGTAVWGPGEATQLAGICGCNALAVTLMAGFIGNKRCTPRVRHWLIGRPRARSGTHSLEPAAARSRVLVESLRCCSGAGQGLVLCNGVATTRQPRAFACMLWRHAGCNVLGAGARQHH
jgi:hypothetical protein